MVSQRVSDSTIEGTIHATSGEFGKLEAWGTEAKPSAAGCRLLRHFPIYVIRLARLP